MIETIKSADMDEEEVIELARVTISGAEYKKMVEGENYSLMVYMNPVIKDDLLTTQESESLIETMKQVGIALMTAVFRKMTVGFTKDVDVFDDDVVEPKKTEHSFPQAYNKKGGLN